VEQKGVAGLTGVATDFDGDTRPNVGTTFPDMGYDEVAIPNCTAANGGTLAPSTSDTICLGLNSTMSVTGFSTGTGISYQWQVGSVSGGPYVNVTGGSGANSTTYTATPVAPGTYYYVQQTTCSFGVLTGVSNEFTLTVVANPVVTVTPDSAIFCSPGIGVQLIADGAGTYAWSPSGTLSAATGDSVVASPTASTSYFVVGTDSNGCIGRDTAFVAFAPSVTVAASVLPTEICFDSSATLTASGLIAAASYCQPVYSSGTGFGDYISLVQLGTINNATLGEPAPYYVLYPAVVPTTTDLTAGNTYTITLSPGTYTVNDLAAWIDFNQNGILNDPNEKLGETDNVGAAPATTTFTFTVPVNASNGPTRLRVRDIDHGTTNDMDPCAPQSSFGETEDYIVTIVGGVDPLTYSWTPGTFLSSMTGDTVIADSVQAPTTYYVTATSAAGCTATDTVTVAFFATPPTAACQSISVSLDTTGVTTVLASAVDSGSTDGCGIASFTLSQSSFTCANVGTNSVMLYVTNVNGIMDSCAATVTVVDALVRSAVAIANPGTGCPGDSATVTGMGMGGIAPYTYLWSTGATTSSINVTPLGTSTYEVTVTDACGSTAVATDSILVTPLPVAGFTTVDNGDGTVTVTITATGGSSYSWDFGDGQTGTQSSSPFNVTYGTSNSFTVTQIVTNSCGSDTLIENVVVTGIRNALGNIHSSVFPNPNAGNFNLVIAEMAGHQVEVSITDMHGVEVEHLNLEVNDQTHQERIDISQFARGIYFVRLKSDLGFSVHKVTLQ
jgi:hypothetical protein